jgi:hypothetical protein
MDKKHASSIFVPFELRTCRFGRASHLRRGSKNSSTAATVGDCDDTNSHLQVWLKRYLNTICCREQTQKVETSLIRRQFVLLLIKTLTEQEIIASSSKLIPGNHSFLR